MDDDKKDPARDHAKHAAVPPVKVPKARPGNDDDDAPAAAAPPSQKMLATALSRAIVIATIIATIGYVASSLFGGRYEVIAALSTNNSFAYRLDRLTGGMEFCSPQQCTDIGRAAGGDK